jgi:hypothetical protein
MLINYVRVWQHPSPPSVTTGGASGVHGSEATVTGTVNPNGIETGYAFEYGETTSYGHHSQPEGKLPAGWGAVPVAARITGLTAGKVYHYRLVASSGAGGGGGVDHTFRVEGQPNLLANSSFLLENAEGNGAVPQGWTAWENSGHVQFGRTVNEENAEQGSTYEEWNANVNGASLGQDVYNYPQVGQNYTFSVWVRAPQATVKGAIVIYGMKGGEARDATATHFTIKGLESKGKGQEGWQLVSVPLTVTKTEEEHIRVQVYEETPNTNLDLDGATLK